MNELKGQGAVTKTQGQTLPTPAFNTKNSQLKKGTRSNEQFMAE